MTSIGNRGASYYLPQAAQPAALSQGPNGTLHLHTGGADDKVDVRRVAGGRYAVNVNQQAFTFSKDELAKLTIHTGRGDDLVRIDKNVDVPLVVKTGRGRDQVYNGGQGAMIDTGAGDDYVASAANGVKVHGGEGSDILDVEGHGNTVSGGMGDDQLRAQGYGNLVQGGAGNDRLWTNGADNFIRGGEGNDQLYLWGTRNRVDAMGGNDGIYAIGTQNRLDTGAGWNQVGVLGYGNLINGALQTNDPRSFLLDQQAAASVAQLQPAQWAAGMQGGTPVAGLALPGATPSVFDALNVQQDLRQWTSDCGSRGCCKWEPAIA